MSCLVLVLVLLITAVNSGTMDNRAGSSYVMDKDYGVDERLFFSDHRNPKRGLNQYRRPLPVVKNHVRWKSGITGEVEPRVAKQEFNPGIWLRLEENSTIKAVL